MYKVKNRHRRYLMMLLRSPSTNIQLNFRNKICKKNVTKKHKQIDLYQRSKNLKWDLTHEEKSLESHRLFLKKIKSSLLDTENERKYFCNELTRSIHLGLDNKFL